MNEVIENFLTENGFNQKDIKIYLDLYKHGQSYASSIALRTKIDRTTVYSVIRRLLARGVIAQTQVNDVKAYIPISPEVFADGIDREIQDLNAKKKVSVEFVKEMLKLQKGAFTKPKVRIYEGEQAIMSLYMQTLKQGKEQKSFINLKNIAPEVKDFLKNQFMKAKLWKKVKSKVIVADTGFSTKYKKMDKRANRQTKIVKNYPFDLHAEIVLFNDREVAIIDFHEQIYGIVIESETMHKTMEALFDFIWASCK